MASRVIDCTSGVLPAAEVGAVARALEAGQLVAFPTETVYGVAVRADLPEAIAALREAKGDRGNKPFALLVSDPRSALHHVSALHPKAARLIRLGWPGPLTLVLPAQGGGTVGLRCPDHAVARAVAALGPAGLASTSANPSDAAPPTSAGAVVEALGDHVALVCDGGPSKLRVPSTVLGVDRDGTCTVLREGAVPRDDIARVDYLQVLFVCSGNTCRSPMAAGLLRRRLAQALEVAEADLPAHGFRVESAGTGAFPGAPASEGAVAAARERGADISAHRSQPVGPQLLEESDIVVGMAGHHLAAVREWLPGDRGRLRPLDPAGDVSDPVGGSLELYRQCAGQIEAGVEALAAELLAARTAGAGSPGSGAGA